MHGERTRYVVRLVHLFTSQSPSEAGRPRLRGAYRRTGGAAGGGPCGHRTLRVSLRRRPPSSHALTRRRRGQAAREPLAVRRRAASVSAAVPVSSDRRRAPGTEARVVVRGESKRLPVAAMIGASRARRASRSPTPPGV